MRFSDIPRDPSPAVLQQFAGLWVLFFGGYALWEGFVRHQPGWALAFGILAFMIGPLGLIRPEVVKPIFVGWMILAFPIAWLVSLVALAIVYYGIFTPLGLVFRLIGRDPLRLRRPPESSTYWTPKPAARDLKSYLKEF